MRGDVNMNYEIVYQTELMDCYRITDGVLLNVKKYKQTNNWIDKDGISKPYHKDCKDLRVLKKEYIDERFCKVYKIGTVIEAYYEVVKCNVSDYTYEIKTTGNLFSGTSDIILQYLDIIKEIINTYNN